MRILVSFFLAVATLSLNLFGTIPQSAQARTLSSGRPALTRSVDVTGPVASLEDSAQQQAPAQQPEASAATFKFTKADLDLLEQVNLLDQQFDKEGLVYHDEALDAYLNRVGVSLLPDMAVENVRWQFRVMRDPVPNAFALPNGSIYVNSGLLSLMDSEAQLAGVLSHEITHVLHRHTYLQNRSNRKKILAINILQTIGFWNPVGGVAGAAINLIATISPLVLELSMFGYSRDLERDADMDGARRLANAGYNPQEMVSTFKLLKKDIEGEQLKIFYSDHPQLNERISYITNLINSKSLKIAAQPIGESKTAYLSSIERAARHDVQLAINSGRFRSAVYVSQKLTSFDPDSPQSFYYLAESYRTLGPRSPELTDKEMTEGAKRSAAKKRNKYTLEEEEARLMQTAAGVENWKANQQKAEELYLKALKLDASHPPSHRGLGMLYEKLGRKAEAINEYQKYLEFAPADAPDRERIRRRLENLRGAQAPQPE
ncbi:MAG: M48 family metalloprotease [Pyrinomonadaceae bacterium]|nr:M48 family metalloprotease [Pyrinomonadaceae bacterium]